MVFVDAIDDLWGFKRRLHQPTNGKTVNIVVILDTANIDSMGNLA